MIDRLAFTRPRHGGKAEDAFDLVIPSIPGYGFSAKPQTPLRPARHRPRLQRPDDGGARLRDDTWRRAATGAGCVTGFLGLDHPAHVKAIHLNMLGVRSAAPPQGEAEIAWAQAERRRRCRSFGGYFQLQASKPQSLAWAMADNPVGQAAWIVERFHDWSDLREKPFETVYSMDRLLTNIMIYVMTGSFTTSVWYYRALFEEGGFGPAAGPAGGDSHRLRQLPRRGALHDPAPLLRRARL